MAGILPAIARSLDVSVAAAGQFVTIYSFAYALLTPITATLTAHLPKRHVLFSGPAVFIVGNILTATQPTFELALLSRAVAGLGGAMVTPTAGAAAAMLAAPERGCLALAIVNSGLARSIVARAKKGRMMPDGLKFPKQLGSGRPRPVFAAE